MRRFQSTHPVRGATRAAYGGRVFRSISIHAPRAGCDQTASVTIQGYENFNPRTPCGVRLHLRGFKQLGHKISIHAPRAGCDIIMDQPLTPQEDFNPRTPCGVRRRSSILTMTALPFQSTHPVRGATHPAGPTHHERRISIHAPRAGCDETGKEICTRTITFQSTHPVRGATHGCGVCAGPWHISIHAPRAGCDARYG